MKEKQKEYQRIYYQNNKKRLDEKTCLWYKNHKKESCEFSRNGRLKVKRLIFSHYSNGKIECFCCGEKNEIFLCIDHIFNNGSEERKRIGKKSGNHFYQYLKNKGFPVGYQVLCYNCNIGKQINKGVCPHKQPVDNLAVVY